MRYNEYTASDNKVLLNINDFVYANKIISPDNLDVIEVSLEEAKYYTEKYQEELREQENIEVEEVIEEPVEEQPVLLKGAKGLRTTTEAEPADPVQRLKNLLKEEMVFKGYNLNNLVEPIIHELK